MYNENENENKLIVIDEEGKKKEYEVLVTFESEETGKNYIVFTDNTLDENGNIKVYANIYTPDNGGSPLLPIESEEEWKIIQNILETLKEDAQMDEIFNDSNIEHGDIAIKEIDE